MLYHAYELQRATLAPLRLLASSAQAMLDLPFNLLRDTQFGKLTAAALNSFEHTTRHFGKPEFGFTETIIDGASVGISEQVVARRPWCDLRHFRRDTDRPADRKLLIVAPMSGHYATLLRGTVEVFLPDHDVFITDWHDARQKMLMEPGFDLDDYIDYVMDFLRLLGPDTHVLAVCQPAVPVLAAVALLNEGQARAAPRSMTLIGGPIDTREAPTEVNIFAKKHSMDWFRHRTIHTVPAGNPGWMRQVYPGFLQLAGFMAMNLDRHVTAHWEMFQHLVEGDGEPLAAKRRFYDEYRSVMDLSAEFYLQTIEKVFHEHELPRGLFRHRDHRIDAAAIERTAMLTIEGERDDISGIGQTRAAHAMTTNLPPAKRAHIEQPEVGHYGLFNGRRFRSQIAPAIKQFMQTHA